ncbi:MAG TPA: tRNA-uridine aminocarboxypropyltransferase [Polyangia bacterium]|nr:tRNA-uridine aminocarboxypropyltransferase [Polyangia bacterium]
MTRAPRAMCAHCRRPAVVCYCAVLPSLATRTRVLVLQHPRERDVGIGTARMAHLALPGSILRVGVDFSADPVVASTLASGAPSYLLFPGAGARDLRELPTDEPITLVVVDGTWSQARKLVRVNPALAALPRVAFTPRRPSDYRIRREPADFCVSTIEALTEALNVLEPDGEPFDPLLDPFRAMVDRQIQFATEVRANRHHRGEPRARDRSPSTPSTRLAADWSRLVCVQGEANGWPIRDPARQDPEIVHFVACRPSTGALYEAVVAPRRPLAPLTPQHLELPAARLMAGGTVEEWRRSWRAFSRDDDVLVQWGCFYAKLAAADGVLLPRRRMDLRGELSPSVRPRGGTLEECVAGFGAPVAPLGLDGRGGRRLSALVALVRALEARQ